MNSMTMKTGSDAQFETGSWQEATHDIYVGLLVGMGHVYKIFVQMPYQCLFGTPTQRTIQPAGGDLKVVGVGFGRTGTVSECVCVWKIMTMISMVGDPIIPSVFGLLLQYPSSLWKPRFSAPGGKRKRNTMVSVLP